MTVEVKKLKQAFKGPGRDGTEIGKSINKTDTTMKRKLKNKKLKKNRSNTNQSLNVNKEDISSLKRKLPASRSLDATASTAGSISIKHPDRSLKKRVSFSTSLIEASSVKGNDEEHTESTPKKSILKRRSSNLDSSAASSLDSPSKKQVN